MARILLVDDDTAAVGRATAALEADGHTVIVATTVAGALDCMRERRPDLVVLEALLDGGTAGFDLARRLATSEPDLPLIMATRVDEQLSRAELDRQDRDGWLPVRRFFEKPVMPEVLVDEIDHLLPAAAAGHGR